MIFPFVSGERNHVDGRWVGREAGAEGRRQGPHEHHHAA